jgi:hypothetical protein
MKVLEASSWDEYFFIRFVSLRNQLYRNEPFFIREDITDFQQLLTKDAPFNQCNDWKAWMIEVEGEVIARIFASTRTDDKKQHHFLPVGYFESLLESSAMKLFSLASDWARDKGYSTIRGPIQGNVFNSSRLKLFGTSDPFYGEPLYRPEYHLYFKNAGFEQSQHWVSIQWGAIGTGMEMLKYLKRKPKSRPKAKTKIRRVDLKQWEREMHIMYDLLMDSYSTMPDVELVTFEEFKVWTDPLKYILRPKDCLILELDGRPMGFVCNIKDHLGVLATRDRISKNYPGLQFAGDLMALSHVKGGMGRNLVLYIGKRLEAENKIKGLGPMLMKAMFKTHANFYVNPPIVGYVANDSPSFRMMPPNYSVVAEYCMYQKNL